MLAGKSKGIILQFNANGSLRCVERAKTKVDAMLLEDGKRNENFKRRRGGGGV